MSDLVARAKALAERAHAGQMDKAGRPYIEHVARVAAAVSDDPEAEAVAWLHDVLEDAIRCEDELISLIGCYLHSIVCALTRWPGVPEKRYYARIRECPVALRVKLADIADNADEARLALLDEATAARLRRKYAKARKELAATP